MILAYGDINQITTQLIIEKLEEMISVDLIADIHIHELNVDLAIVFTEFNLLNFEESFLEENNKVGLLKEI